ncbi:MAG TPA: serine hydrolase [Polyangiaceae bacterium]|nr:serine hydrolase [Polyangiaceae bacterium]
MRRLLAAIFLTLTGSCASAPPSPSPGPASSTNSPRAPEIDVSTPEAQGMARAPMVQLARWIRDTPVPIFSLLVSRHGKLVFELYTSSFDRDDAHYLMSVTKSVVSALVGIAVDRHLVPGPDATVGDLLPRGLFPSDADQARFRGLTLRQVMGMQGLDAPDPPRDKSPEALARYHRFWTAPSRLRFVLAEPLLGQGFQYNDATPTLATGVLRQAAGESVLRFAEETLFGPMGFRNEEWMHEDPSGLDNGGYGLRLRPVDMQKLGLLYLHHGVWNGRQLVSAEWVARSFQPWNRSKPDAAQPDYGWFWWAYDFGPGWSAHVANGWKGQRIAVFPDQDIVLTMTGCIDDGTEHALFEELVKKVLIPSVTEGATATLPGNPGELAALLDDVHRGPPRLGDWIEYRMVPSTAPKGRRLDSR